MHDMYVPTCTTRKKRFKKKGLRFTSQRSGLRIFPNLTTIKCTTHNQPLITDNNTPSEGEEQKKKKKKAAQNTKRNTSITN